MKAIPERFRLIGNRGVDLGFMVLLLDDHYYSLNAGTGKGTTGESICT